jgi:hypothetical protein
MASLLSIVQQFSQRQGLGAGPSTVMGSTDAGIIQMKATLEEECIALASRGPWQTLQNELTWTSLAAEVQGSISAGLGSGPSTFNAYRYMASEVIWDRTSKLPIFGALDADDYQYLKAVVAVGPWGQFRWRGDSLLIIPAPAAGHTMALEYITDNWVALQGVAANGARLFANDTDTVRLKDDIVLLGLRWRWLKTKGFAYAEDFNAYEDAVKDALSRDKRARRVNMTGSGQGLRPSVTIPLWNTIS